MPDKIVSKEEFCRDPLLPFRLKQSSGAEECPQENTSESTSSDTRRDTGKIRENMPQSKGNSDAEERQREINGIQKRQQDNKEKTEQGLKELRTFVEDVFDIVRKAELEKAKRAFKKQASVTFAIKAATKDRLVENQIIEYIRKEIPRERLEMKTTFEWEKRQPVIPLVVFCNYSSMIWVDVEVSLRGVEDSKVILIILHYVLRALIKGDLSDDDSLLPDNLKDRAACIAHFAFDKELYDCKQNRCSRDKLCSDLKKLYNTASNDGLPGP